MELLQKTIKSLFSMESIEFGKEITEMERVKAYLMYQIYINEKSLLVEKTIKNTSDLFEKIYLSINSIKINEDDLLWYHCNAYYGYLAIDDNYDTILDFLKEIIGLIKEKDLKINFIIQFVNDLETTFANIEKMENDKNNVFIRRLRILGIQSFQILYPLIINGYRYFNNSKDYFVNFFKIIELLAFRISLIRINGNVKLNSRLDRIVGFNGNLNKLCTGIIDNFSGDEWRWTDESMEDVLNGSIYGKMTDNVLHYILKVYEEKISGKECPNLKKIWIEHISPKSPRQEENTGYELTKKYKYSKKFESEYLDCLGNLVLSTAKQNRDLLGNKNFKDKLAIYNNPKLNLGLKQQEEIKLYVDKNDRPFWGYKEISLRHEKMVKFIMNEWGFINIEKESR